MRSGTNLSHESEKLKASKCRFCKEPIEWVLDSDGHWIAARPDLMGAHSCIGSRVPRGFEFEEET